MQFTKDEALEEIAHQGAMIRALRKRLRALELQMAQRGMTSEPHVLTEITSITEQIVQREDEIVDLETIAAEDQLPLSEVEYRVQLAEAWNTPQGRPSVIGSARLELTRLKLRLLPERAQELEHEIKVALAKEALGEVDVAFFTSFLRGYMYDHRDETFHTIGRAIRLNVDIVIEWLNELMPKDARPQPLTSLQSLLIDANSIWIYQREYALIFTKFADRLPSILKQPGSVID